MPPISQQAIQQFKLSLSSSAVVLTPSSEGYKESISRWASTADKQAALVVFPITPQDVAAAVRFNISNGLQFAVGSGFHGFFSSTEGGMSINLSKMNSVLVDPILRTITVAGGALWSDVDVEAAKHGLAAVGGTVNSVGVAGLTLGGGYGYLTGKHGLAIDNLSEVELVLASGEIVIANEKQNQDLFWAIRGAGANFGVVTKLVFKAHVQENLVWGGNLGFGKAQLKDVIDFANHMLEKGEGEASMMVGFNALNSPAAAVTAVVFYNGLEEAARDFYAPLLALKPVFDETAIVPYEQVNSWHNAAVGSHGARRAMKGAALLTPVNASFVEELFEQYDTLVMEVPDAKSSLVLFDFFGYNKIMEVPQTSTAFANRGALVNVLFAPAWKAQCNDSVCKEWALEMATRTQLQFQSERSNGTDEMTTTAVGEYSNYDGLGSSSAHQVFGTNFARLVDLKKRYDPANIFRSGHDLLPGEQAGGLRIGMLIEPGYSHVSDFFIPTLDSGVTARV